MAQSPKRKHGVVSWTLSLHSSWGAPAAAVATLSHSAKTRPLLRS